MDWKVFKKSVTYLDLKSYLRTKRCIEKLRSFKWVQIESPKSVHLHDVIGSFLWYFNNLESAETKRHIGKNYWKFDYDYGSIPLMTGFLGLLIRKSLRRRHFDYKCLVFIARPCKKKSRPCLTGHLVYNTIWIISWHSSEAKTI